MAIPSRIVETVFTVAATAVGVPLIVMLFLGVLGYCYLEWLLDMLAAETVDASEAHEDDRG